MSIPQVGSASFAVVPTFVGFRKAVTSETDAAGKSAASGFRRLWSKEGSESGKTTGAGFKKAFEGQATGFSSKATRELEQAVAKSASALSAARLKEQDAAGKVRVAERQLAEAREKYASDSSQVIRAEERLATAARQLETAQDKTKSSTSDLADAQNKLARAADRAADQLDESGRKGASKFSTGFSEIFKGSFLGTTVAGLASSLVSNIGQAIGTGLRTAIDFGLGALDLAGQLEQSVGAVEAVFKENGGVISEWASTAAQDVGLSRNAYNGLAAVVGAQLKNMGYDLDAATTSTGDLVRLGADLAAQFGGSTSDAVSALSSLLRGERDPIERYGVSIKDADIEARLAAKGLSTLEGEARKQAEAQETLALLFEQSADAIGTFDREYDTFAGKKQRNAAVWENLQTRIGEGFLPIASAVATVLADDVFPVISELIDKYGPQMTEAFEAVIPSLRDMAETILPKLPELFDQVAQALPLIVDGISTFLPPLIDFGGKLVNGAQQISDFFGGLITWAEEAGVNLGLFVITGGGLLGEIGRFFYDTGVNIGNFFSGFGGALVNGGRQIGDFVSTVSTGIGEAVRFIGELPVRITAAVATAGVWLYNSGKAVIQGFIDGINDMFKPVGDAVGGIMEFVGGFFPRSPAKHGPFSGSGWSNLPKSGQALMDQWSSGMSAASYGPAVSAGLVASVASGSASRSTPAPAIYVQNPFTGDYLLAQVDHRAAGVVAGAAQPFKGGRRP